MRPLLIESALLALIGIAGGALIAAAGNRFLIAQLVTPYNRISLDLSLDQRMMLFTIAVGAITVLVTGLTPALRSSATEASEALKAQARSVTERSSALASGMVVAQIALSLTLVVLAGLLIRTFAALEQRSLGFDRDRVLLALVDAHRAVPVTGQLAFSQNLPAVLGHVPGVTASAVSIATPVSGSGFGLRAEVSGGVEIANTGYGVNAMTNVISPGFFDTLGTAVLAGRDFGAGDITTSPRVAIVNRALARAALGDASPIGHTITLSLPSRTFTAEIVGVVADAVYMSAREPILPTVYTPLSQYYLSPSQLMPISVSVRADIGSPTRFAKGIEAAIVERYPDVALSFVSLSDQVRTATASERIVAILSGAFGVLAILLAAVGLYGVTAHGVARRRTEIGIRVALGATQPRVMRLIMRRVSGVILAGIAIGSLLSTWIATLVAALLFGLGPHDLNTFVAAATVLTVVGIAAGGLPACRASRVDPAEVLREG